MKTVARMELVPGMELAENVYSYKNELVIKEHTVLDQALIDKLARYSIMCVSIKDAADLARTHFEWVRTSASFQKFEQQYKACMENYKSIMLNFLNNEVPLNINALMSIYKKLSCCASTGEQLLDYLYNLIPSEDELTHAHCLNSALICGVFGNWLCLSDEDIDALIQCGFCYDIGKLQIPDSLLWKAEKLTAAEYDCLKTHTVLGYELLKHQNLNDHVLTATLQHHERSDGSGYPHGLKDTQIDIFAKYLAIVDSYEAMTSARVYRPTLIPFQVIQNFEKTGCEKYGAGILLPILERIANSQMGMTVRLSDERIADVILINKNALTRPLLKCGNELLDLAKMPEVEITAVL